MPTSDLDYSIFLLDDFDSRQYAQSLLNGTAIASRAQPDGEAPADSIDPRSIEALQQLGLSHSLPARPSGANVAASFESSAKGNNLANGELIDRSKRDAFASTFAKAGSGDVSAALAKLSSALDGLNRQLRSEINTHHAALLIQAGSVSVLQDNLSQVRTGLSQVEGSVERLQRKIATPYVSLSTNLERLAKLQSASDLARRANRFVTLARRLDVQMAELDAANARLHDGPKTPYPATPAAEATPRMSRVNSQENIAERRNHSSGERALGEAALTLAELDMLLQDNTEAAGTETALVPSIRSIHALRDHVPAVEANRERVINAMEIMIRRGLQELNQSLLASSLQTAYNLSVLPPLVASLVQDLIEAIESRIKNAFDVNALARDAALRAGEPYLGASAASSVFYKSRAKTEPTSSNLSHFQAALWNRLEGLIEDMAGCCIKVYVLERVLKLKKDQTKNATFLDDALTVLENKPTFTFWTTLSQSFETHSREAARSSNFVQQSLSLTYPRLLRLFHEFFSKIALQSDTVYAQTQQSPETVLILRSISSFESSYIVRSQNRMLEAVGQAFANAQRNPPGSQEGIAVARVISNELDAARFDPLLVKSIAKTVAKAIDSFVDRSETLCVTDYTAVSLAGPHPTAAQQINADLATALYHLWSPLTRVLVSYPQEIQETLRLKVKSIIETLSEVTTPLFAAIRREVAAIIARMHRTGYNKPLDPTTTSVFMQDLSDKLGYIRRQILAPLRIGELSKEWVIELCKFTIQRFVLHMSIVHPLGEGGKLKLTTDCTTLEFAVAQLLGDFKLNLSVLGDSFRVLRSFRPLLFLETAALVDAKQTADVPAQILLHHIIVRAGSIPMPHQVQGWQETEYVKFVSEHSDHENRKLVEIALKDWEDKGMPVTEAGKEHSAAECVALARQVLDREKQREAATSDS